MVRINRAYDTLADAEKRARYDRTGEDAAPQRSTEDLARDAIRQNFMAVLERSGDADNVIDLVEAQLKDNLARLNAGIAAAEKRVTKLTRAMKRLKCRRRKRGDEEPNFLALVLTDAITKTNAGIETARQGVAVLELAREMLSDFSWQADPKPDTPSSAGVWTFATVFADHIEEIMRCEGKMP